MKKKIIISLFILSLLFLSNIKSAHAFVGNNPLLSTPENTDHEVNLNAGEANHSINLQVPPGTNGLTPNLSLEYHSSAAEYQSYNAFRSGNLFGSGWSIDFPYIYRDTNSTPGDTSDDYYRIDWQGASYKLISQGSGVYKTNIETFTKITHVSSGSPNNATGDYWTIQTTDGTTYRFGYNADSEVACSNRSFTLEWVLDDVTDTHSNNIYYNYAQNPNSNDIGAIYPLNIKYNNDQNREIDFATDTTDATGMAKNYFGGCLVRYARNIKTITTKANGSQVKKYTLNYSSTVARSLLTSFTEAGSNNTTKPSNTFTNFSEQSGWPSSTQTWGDPGPNFGNAHFIDMNGDGLPDIAYFDSQGWKVWYNTGSGFTSTYALWGNPGPDFTNTHLVDMNGDGLPDMLYWDSSGWHVWWNTGSGWSSTSTFWGNPGPDQGSSQFYDMNGDGLMDLLYWDSSGWHVWMNTGTGWASSSTFWGNPGPDLNGTHFIDMNGDGLPDMLYIDSSGWKVWMNTGSGWLGSGGSGFENWGNPGVSFSDPIRLIDMNGDGLTDLLYTDSSKNWKVWYNTGTGWASSSTAWGNNGLSLSDNNVFIFDINGDGLPDLVKYDHGWPARLNPGHAPDLLSSITTALGGSISFDYAASTGFDNTGGDSQSDLPFPVWAVTTKTVNNGLSNSQGTNDVTTYSYKNGLYNWQKKEFRGFGEVDETDPNGSKKQTFFKQDDGLKGTMYDQKTNDASGNAYLETLDTWNSSSSSGVFTNTLGSEKKYTYDGSASNPKIAQTDYTYDSYGNVTEESDLGDTSTNNDDRYIHKQYTYNTSSWIVNLPYDTYTNGTGDTTKVSETWDYYDGNTGLTDAPTKGDLTKETKWLSGGTNPVTTYTYDSYGNKTQVTDDNSHSTSWSYGTNDTTHTYPDSTTNAKSQTTSMTYDLETGNPLTKTDPNGFTTTYTFDPFGRVSKEIDPYDSSSFPTKSYTYYDNSTAPQGILASQLKVSSQSGTLDSYTFVDGLGRKIQTRKPAEDTSKQIVTDTFYNSNGKVTKESVPHLDTLSSTYVTPLTGIENTVMTYDPIARVTQVTNPQGTSKTTSYDHWSQTDTDENGHTKKKVMDAFNNITEVDEHNNGSTYTTTYQYDPLDNLTKITDANSNNFTFTYDTLGRKVTEVDPDMGTWTYTYDGVDNLLTKTDSRGKTTTNTYDQLNRKASVSYPTDTGITYTYDGNGKIGTLTSVTDAAGTVSYSYDNRLRKTQEQRVTDGITWAKNYTYDAANRILTTTMPDSEVVSNTYDAQGEVASVSGVVNNVDYNALNKVTGKTFNNGQTTNYTYNTSDFRLNRIQTGSTQDIGYTYDTVGNVKTTTDNLLSKTQTFGYDNLDRLTIASESAGYNHTYAYDPIGNMTTFSSPDTTTNYTYGSSTLVHAPATTTSTTMIYDDSLAYGWTDASFNTTNSVQTTNVYSGANALSSAINANGGLDFQAPRFFTTGGYSYVHFALRASTSGQQYKVYADSTFGQALTTPVSLASYGGQPTISGWTVYNIPLADLAASNVTLGDIVIQNATGSNEPAVYVDQVELMSGTVPTPTATPTPTAAPTATPTPTPATPALVQKTEHEGGGTGSVAASFSSNVTSGNAIVVMTITGSASTLDTTSVTDNHSNTYTRISNGSNHGDFGIFRIKHNSTR